MTTVKIILSILSFVIGIALLFGIMSWFGIDVVGTIMQGLEDLKEIFVNTIRNI